MLDEFYDTALKNDSLPIVVLFPTGKDIQRYRRSKRQIYAPLVKYLKARGYRFIDLQEGFNRYGQSHPVNDFIMRRFLHYSPLGNEIAAKCILEYLKENHLTNLDAIRNELSHARTELLYP